MTNVSTPQVEVQSLDKKVLVLESARLDWNEKKFSLKSKSVKLDVKKDGQGSLKFKSKDLKFETLVSCD